MKSNLFLTIGSLSAAIAVILGAFGVHSLKPNVTAEMLSVYQTGIQYHFYHSLGILIIGVLLSFKKIPLLTVAGWSMLGGIFLFSGSLYLLSITGVRWLGAITPIGGIAFVVSWILLAAGVLRNKE